MLILHVRGFVICTEDQSMFSFFFFLGSYYGVLFEIMLGYSFIYDEV